MQNVQKPMTDEEVDAYIEQHDTLPELAPEESTDTTEETPTDDGGDTTQETVTEEAGETSTETEEITEEPVEETEFDAFHAYGLDKQYSTPEEAFKAVVHARQEIGRLEWEKQQLEKRLNTPKTESKSDRVPLSQIDPEDFLNNPAEAIAKAGYVSAEQVQEMVQRAISEQTPALLNQRQSVDRMNQFIESKSDYNDLEPIMLNILDRTPGLRALPPDQSIQTLYEMAQLEKARHTKPKKQVVLADPDKKDRAKTAGGRQPAQTKSDQKKDRWGLTPMDYETKPPEEIERIIGFGDE